MGRIGKIIKTKIETFIIQTIESRFGYNNDCELYGPSGDDSPGLDDDRVYISKKDGSGKHVVLGVLVSSQGAEKGEKILYSRDSSGAVKAKIYFQKDGKLNIETDDDITITAASQKKVRVENGTGYYELDGATGQFKTNDNFTVDV